MFLSPEIIIIIGLKRFCVKKSAIKNLDQKYLGQENLVFKSILGPKIFFVTEKIRFVSEKNWVQNKFMCKHNLKSPQKASRFWVPEKFWATEFL